MSVTVRIPTILRTYTDGVGELTVLPTDSGNPTLSGVLEALEARRSRYRRPGPRLLWSRLRRFVNVYVDDEDVRFLDGLGTATPAGSTVSVIPAVAGG